MPTGIDQSWGKADAKAAKAAGVQVVSGYLSWSPAKNWDPASVKAYHGQGIGVLLNWESQTGAPLNGPSQGAADADEAVRQARALIASLPYSPRNRPVIYFSCDRDVNSSQWPTIDGYYLAAKALCAAAGFGIGAYGEADLVHHLAGDGITDAEWQTYAWSRGVLDPATDFYQYDNGQRLGGADVDFDRVINAAALGAWWPPNHPLNTSPEEDMPLSDDDLAKIRNANRVDLAEALHVLLYGSPTDDKGFIQQDNRPGLLDGLGVIGHFGNVGTSLAGVARVLSAPTVGVIDQLTAVRTGMAKFATLDAITATVKAQLAALPATVANVDNVAVASAVVAAVQPLLNALPASLGDHVKSSVQAMTFNLSGKAS